MIELTKRKLINHWIIKVDSLGNIQRLSSGSKSGMLFEYSAHHYVVNDGYHVVSVESEIKEVVI